MEQNGWILKFYGKWIKPVTKNHKLHDYTIFFEKTIYDD
jgi:hypothetical protein